MRGYNYEHRTYSMIYHLHNSGAGDRAAIHLWLTGCTVAIIDE